MDQLTQQLEYRWGLGLGAEEPRHLRDAVRVVLEDERGRVDTAEQTDGELVTWS